jgi:hypothetical protein
LFLNREKKRSSLKKIQDAVTNHEIHLKSIMIFRHGKVSLYLVLHNNEKRMEFRTLFDLIQFWQSNFPESISYEDLQYIFLCYFILLR